MKRKILIGFSVAFVIAAFSWVSGNDYEMAVNDSAYWCQMIDEEVWYSSDDEYSRRCGE